MLLLLASASLTVTPPVPAPKAEARARASVRIVRAATASRKIWEQRPEGSRSEIVIRDERGQPLLLRLIEYQ